MKRRIERIAGLTPEQRALFLLRRKQKTQPRYPRSAGRADQPVPASPDQVALWFFHQIAPRTSAYNVVSACLLRGVPDVALFQKSFHRLTSRHESLRTTFFSRENTLYQSVSPSADEPLYLMDVSRQIDEATLNDEITRLVQIPFDLESGPLIRLILIRRSPKSHILLALMHHAITDWISFRLLFRDLFLFYHSAFSGGSIEPPALPIQFADYALRRQKWLTSEECARQREFWINRLRDAPLVLEIPTDKPRPATRSFRGARLFFDLSPELTATIRFWNRKAGASSLMTVLTAVFAFLQRYTGAEDLLVATGAANRDDPETKDMIGYLLNLVVIRADLSGDPDFPTLLNRIKTEVLAAQRNRLFPFRSLVEELKPARDAARNPIYQVEFNHVAVGETGRSKQRDASMPGACPGLTQKPFLVDRGSASSDLQISFIEFPDGFQLWLEYAVDLFEKETVRDMGRLLIKLMAAWTADPPTPLSRVDWLKREQRRALLRQDPWRAPEPRRLHQWFEERARERPHAAAIVMPLLDDKPIRARVLTYAALNQTADRLARLMRRRGVGPDKIVAIAAQRTPSLIAALFGVLKAGGCYLPLDPNLPRARLLFMLEDGDAHLLLADTDARERIGQTEMPVLELETQEDVDETRAAASTVLPENAAYLLYTSGSTGRPKGVLITHAGAANFLYWLTITLNGAHLSRALAAGTIAFDLSFIEIFTPLAVGGSLILVDTPFRLPELPSIWRPRFVMTTPSAMEALLRLGESPSHTATLVLGGEAVSEALLKRLFELDGVEHRFNFYGPTEVSVCTLATRLSREMSEAPLGSSAAGARVYVLDRHLAPAPFGVQGELYLAGPGLARGYHRRPDLTAARFLPNPFERAPGARMYRTGDLARRKSSGAFYFMGRGDDQVKIRGHRIETGEIEAVLRACALVAEAVVVVVNQPVKRLAAHIVLSESLDEPARQIRRYCEGCLPLFMVPALFYFHEQMPLQTSGKIDREALIQSGGVALPPPTKTHITPNNKKEKLLVKIWRKVLKIEKIGVHDNFFSLGGDSILALLVVGELREQGLSCSPTLLFQKQTIAELAESIPWSGTEAAKESTRPRLIGPSPCTPIQRRFFEQAGANQGSWAFGFLMAIKEKPLCEPLAKAFQELGDQHPVLRSVFKYEQGQWRQFPGVAPMPDMVYVDLSGLRGEEPLRALGILTNNARNYLNYRIGRLACLTIIALPRGRRRCLLLFDHLAMDMVSWRIALADLTDNYRRRQKGRPPVRRHETMSFSEWSTRHADWAAEITEPQRGFWIETIQDQTVALPLDFPVDLAQNTVEAREMVACDISVDLDLFFKNLEKSRMRPEEILVAALASVLSDWTGERRVDVHLEGHGRTGPSGETDLSRSIGWFTILYPLALELKAAWRRPSGQNATKLLKHIKTRMRAIPNHGIGYGLLRYFHKQNIPESRAPVSFNYLGRYFSDPDALFTPIPDTQPQLQHDRQQRAHLLEITAVITKRGASLCWFYSSRLHRRAVIEHLAEQYRRVLLELVSVCEQAGADLLSPSDFPEIALTTEELAAVLDEIED